MIVYTSKECTLQIPKGLGNFAADSVDIEPLSGSVVELSATTVNLSGAVETLEGETSKNKADIAALSGKVDNLSSSTITGLDTRVSGNTEDIAALSAQTTANTAHIETLSASTVAMNNSVTANTANIATLSGITSGLAASVETLGEVKEDIYVYLKDLNAMTTEEKTAAWKALEEKYLAGHSIYLVAKSDNPTTDLILPLVKYQPHREGEKLSGYFGFSVIEGGGNAFYDVTFWQRGTIFGSTGPRATKKVMYTLPKASSSKLGGIKVGSGLTMSGEFLNLEIGEGLGFSGNTLVVSGGSENGPRVIFLDEMTQSERVDLYNEIFQYTEKTFPAGNYRFFVTNEGNDEYQGRFEVFVARFYQGDDVSFSGLMQSRSSNMLLQRGYKLTSTGDFQKMFENNLEFPRDLKINITSGGTIDSNLEQLYYTLGENTNNRGTVLAPFPVLFMEEIPYSGKTYYAGTIEAFTLRNYVPGDSSAIFTSKIEWNGRTRVGKWKIWWDEKEIRWRSQTLYWGWLMNGLVCVYDDEYSNWPQAEKEEWYDRIIDECWNYDNTSFGLIRVSDKTSSADTGYNQMRASYSIYKLDSIEAGYNSLHFSGSEKDGDGPSERLYNARIARGGSIEYWEKRADLSKLDKVYDAFIVAQYDNGNKNLTGITHNTKATMWETYKIEGNEGYARKTVVAYVHTGDVVPARFNLISVEGNMGENENGVKLYFGAVYNSIADSSLHSVRFSLSKNVETDVYTIGDIVEYSYTATV